MEKSRVPVLDGFRVLAIGMVMLGHYYNFSNNNIVKYLAIHGYLGVQFFFIISGFVISISLKNSKNYKQFLIKRYIRLAPGMFVCSTLTFLFFKFVYTGSGYGYSKDPVIKYYYIDNSYWSLWIEVNFYIIIGFLYFLSPKKVIRNYTLICIIGIPIFILFSSKMGHSILQNYITLEKIKYFKLIGRSFAFFHECLWFLIGLFLHKLYLNKRDYKNIFIMSFIIIILALWGS